MMSSHRYMNTFHQYLDLLQESHDERRSAIRVLKSLPRLIREQLEGEVSRAIYSRRWYGKTGHACCYTWVHHPRLPYLDPWPATKYPKAVLCMELARVLHL